MLSLPRASIFVCQQKTDEEDGRPRPYLSPAEGVHLSLCRAWRMADAAASHACFCLAGKRKEGGRKPWETLGNLGMASGVGVRTRLLLHWPHRPRRPCQSEQGHRLARVTRVCGPRQPLPVAGSRWVVRSVMAATASSPPWSFLLRACLAMTIPFLAHACDVRRENAVQPINALLHATWDAPRELRVRAIVSLPLLHNSTARQYGHVLVPTAPCDTANPSLSLARSPT